MALRPGDAGCCLEAGLASPRCFLPTEGEDGVDGGGLSAGLCVVEMLSWLGALPSERTRGRLRGRGGLDVEAVLASCCCPRGDLGGVSEG